MLWLIATGLGFVGGLLTGGSVDNVARKRFRWPLVLVLGVVVRAAVLLPPLNRVDAARYAYALTLAAIVLWTVWNLRVLRGMWLITAGAAMNLLVIIANGARMPVAPALAGASLRGGPIGQYTLMSASTNLNSLCDWISVPFLPETYSPGDLVTAAGLALVAFFATRGPREVEGDRTETSGRIVSGPP